MEHLLSIWPEIAGKLKVAKNIWLFTDYDGTLTPIVQRPEQANLSKNTRNILEMLARCRGLNIGIISGRAISELKNLVQVTGIYYAGNHGMEIEGPGMHYLYPVAQDIQKLLKILHKVLTKALYGIHGVVIEDKGLTLSVHYRQVDRNHVENVKDIFNRSIGGLNATKKIRITTGKEILEVRPTIDWNKGKAIKLILKRSKNVIKEESVVYIYLGDDLTDEDAFSQANKYNNSITVFVGNNSQVSEARYYLNSTGEVTCFLEQLLVLTRSPI